MLPVGGAFTVDAAAAWKLVEQLSPKVVIPMHYKTPRASLPLAPVEDFIGGRQVERPGSSILSLAAADLGPARRIVVLEPAN